MAQDRGCRLDWTVWTLVLAVAVAGCGAGEEAGPPPHAVAPPTAVEPGEETTAADRLPQDGAPSEMASGELDPSPAEPPTSTGSVEPLERRASPEGRELLFEPAVESPTRLLAEPLIIERSAVTDADASSSKAEPRAMLADSMEPSAGETDPQVPADAEPTEREGPAVSLTPSVEESLPAGMEEHGEYTMVTVFYGTDRAALDVVTADRYQGGVWLTGAAILAGTLLALGLAVLGRGGRAVRGAAVCGILASAAFAAVAVWVYRPARAEKAVIERVYGPQRGALEMGIAEVSIPKRHRVGEIERPSVFRLELREDPERHVALLSLRQEEPEAFFAALRERVDSGPRREAFVFVHGFNVTFEAAAWRTAQMAYDLRFEGAPIFYSWPSQGGLLKYAVDETNVVWTVPHLKEFLLGVAEHSGAEAIHLIAHSMGNRALTAALHQLSYELGDEARRFREVILTAPDIDADVFRRDIAPAVTRTADRVTLYASSNDEALIASKRLHGYPRAGDAGSGLVVVPGIDTIDVSAVDTSLIGHSYYGANDTVLTDLAAILHKAAPPDRRRWLRPSSLGPFTYWVFHRDHLTQLPAATGNQ